MNVGFLWKHCSVKVHTQARRGDFCGLRGVVAGSLGFLSSCMSTWGTRSCLLREVRSPLALRGSFWDSSRITSGMNNASSRVEAGTSGFLSISDIDLEVSAELEQGSQASSCVEARNSGCLLSCSWGVRPVVELYLEPAAFSGECNRIVSAPSCCDFILGVTFEEVPAHQTYLEFMGNSVFLQCGPTHEASA